MVDGGLPMTPVLQDGSFSSPKSFEDGSYLNDIFERKSPLGLSNKRQFRRPAQSKGNARSSRTSAAFQTIEDISDSDLSTNSTESNLRPKSFYIKTRSKSVAINATLGDEGMSESASDSSVSSAACPSNGIETFGSRHSSKTRSKSFHPKTGSKAFPINATLGDEELSDSSLTQPKNQPVFLSLSSYSVSKFNIQTCPDESLVEEKRASHLNSSGKTKKRVSNCTSHRTDCGTEAEDYSTLADFSMFALNDIEDASYQYHSDVKTSESRDESLHDGSDESPNSANFSSFNATLGPQHGPSRISIGTNMNEFFAKPLHPVNKRLERFSSTSLTKSNDSISLLSKCMQKQKKTSPKNHKASCGRTLRDRDDSFPKYAASNLARPAYWVTNRLYSFLEEKLYSEHGIYSKRVAEKIIQFLQEKCKKLMKTSDTESEDEIIPEIRDVMVKLRIINSDFMFHYLCQQFLPDEISSKIVPSLLPYSESCSRPNYDFTNLFTKFF